MVCVWTLKKTASLRYLQARGSSLSVVLVGDAVQDDGAVMWGSHTIQPGHVCYGAKLDPSKLLERKQRF